MINRNVKPVRSSWQKKIKNFFLPQDKQTAQTIKQTPNGTKQNPKKWLSSGIALVLLAGFLVLSLPVGIGHAQFEPPPETRSIDTRAQQTLSNIPCEVGFFSIGNLLSGKCIAKAFAWFGFMILSFFAELLSMAGLLFDAVIDRTLDPEIYDLDPLKKGWGTARDFANLFFIFILLTIAIATILRIETYGAKALLPKLIIAALFINFSFLITQYVIFSSNLLADIFIPRSSEGGRSRLISEKLATGLNPQNILKDIDVGSTEDYAKLAELKAERDRLSEIRWRFFIFPTTPNYTPEEAERLGQEIETMQASIAEQQVDILPVLINIFVVIIFAIIIFAVAAFVYLAGAILLITRMAVLWILLVLSPIAFLFMILPATKSYANKWWHTLFSQAFFPVAFFFLFSLPLFMIDDRTLAVLYQVDSTKGGFPTSQALLFTTLIIMFILALVVAKQMGAYGAGAVMSWGKAGAKWARGTFVGAPSRRVLGGAAALALKTPPAKWISKIPLARQALRPLAAGARVTEKQAEEDVKRLKGLSIREQSRLIPTLTARAQAFAFRDMKDQDAGKLMKEMGSGERQRFGKRMKGFNEELGRKAAGATGSIKEAATILYDAPSKPPPKNTTQGREYQGNLAKLFKELKADQLGAFDLEKELKDEDLNEYVPEVLLKGLNKENISGITKNTKNADVLRNVVQKEADEHGMRDENKNIKFDEFARHIRTTYDNNSLAEYFQSTPARRFYGSGSPEEKKEGSPAAPPLYAPSGQLAREELESPTRREPKPGREEEGPGGIKIVDRRV